MAQRYATANNEQSTREDAGSPQSGDGSTKNQADRVGGDTTDKGADLEERDGEEVDPFD